MVDVGDINHAENQLYEIVSGGDMEKLKMALLFYSYLNDKSDDFLTEHDFSRGEIKSGIKGMVSMYGLDSMADVFLSDM